MDSPSCFAGEPSEAGVRTTRQTRTLSFPYRLEERKPGSDMVEGRRGEWVGFGGELRDELSGVVVEVQKTRGKGGKDRTSSDFGARATRAEARPSKQLKFSSSNLFCFKDNLPSSHLPYREEIYRSSRERAESKGLRGASSRFPLSLSL